MLSIGFGYDVHRLVENRDLILGGVKIDYKLGLLGHSDADVLVHAIIDSLLGSVAMRDIGFHFPDNDSKFKNIDSLELLLKTLTIIRRKYSIFEVLNIDCTVVMQEPKICKYIDEMQSNIAKIINIDKNKVSIKGKTTEMLGFTGRSEGIECHAICLTNKLL